MNVSRLRKRACPGFYVVTYGFFDSEHHPPSHERATVFYELEFFPEGVHGRAVIDGKEHSIRRGSFICAKPGQTRQSVFPLRCFYVHVHTTDPELIAFLNSIPDTGVLPHLADANSLFQLLLSVDNPKAVSSRLLIHSCACRLMELFSRAGRLAQRNSSHLEAILAAEEYIQTHLAENLNLEAIARAVNLSPYYFHHLFTDFFGKTPAQYILDCRIAIAKQELLKESCSVSALAADCGFSSHSYFSQKFKQVTGKTPLQFRREVLGRSDL